MVEISGDQGMEVVDLRFDSLRDLQEDFGPYLSTEGFFLRERGDFAASDVLRFRLMLPGDFVLIEGVGVVVWVRSPAEATPTAHFGAAVGFATLSDQGRELVERIVHSHIECGGKPFDMSRPAENGDPQPSQSDEETAQGASGEQGDLKFSVREDPAPDLDDEPMIGDPEQRLPFEATVEPDVDEAGADGEVNLLSEPVLSEGDDGDVDEVSGAETTEDPELLDDGDRTAFSVDTSEPLVQGSEPVLTEPSGMLEISLQEDRDSMADRQASWEREEAEPDSSDPQEKKGSSGLIRILIGIVVVVVGAWAVSTQFPEYMPWLGTASDAVVAESDEPPVEDLKTELMEPLTDDDLEAAVEAAVDAATGPEPAESTEPQPTEPPAPVEVVGAPGHTIVDIKADAGESGTVILIRTDGLIESGRVRTSILPSPPRILVRVSGIDSLYRPLEIPVGTSEVRGIRVGYHPETRPPSLWIVLDRSDEDVVVRDVQTSGNVVRVEVGR